MKRLREWLEVAGITQTAFSKTIGVKPPTVSQWLSGEYFPSTEKLLAISRVTGISMERLLEDKPSPPEKSQPQAAA